MELLKLYRAGEYGVRTSPLATGEKTDVHRHDFGHVTACSGRIRIDKYADDARTITDTAEFGFKMERMLAYIEPNVYHQLTALEDSIYCCIYTSRDPDGTPIGTWSGEASGAFQ